MRNRIIRAITFIVILAACGGCSKRDNQKPGSVPVVAAPDTASYRLLIGKKFPNIQIIDLEGNPVSTGGFYARGRVILFLEPTCGFCERMIGNWQKQIEQGAFTADEVVAIVPATLEMARNYKANYSIPFAIYADTGLVFLERFQVADFPLQLVVGQSGTINDYNFQVDRQIFADQIHRQFED